MKRFSVIFTWVFIFMLMFSLSVSAATIELGGSSSSVSKISGNDARVAWQISQAYQIAVSAGHVNYLYNQNFDYGEIGIIYGLLSRTDKTIGEIIDLRLEENLGWNQIAQRLGVQLSEITDITSGILAKAKLEKEISPMEDLLKSEEKAAEKGVKAQSAAKTKPTDRSASPGVAQKPIYRSSGKSTF